MTPEATVAPERAAVVLARTLRDAGVEVPVDSVITFARAWEAVGADTASGAYWAGRATLVRRPEDLDTFDAVFAALFAGDGTSRPGCQPPSGPADRDGAPGDDRHESVEGSDPDRSDGVVSWSAIEQLRQRDFAALSDDEREEAMRLLGRLRLRQPRRASRRRRPARRSGARLDLRRTTRAAVRTDGEPMARRWTEPVDRPRPVVLLIDVSGSMTPHARALLRFAQAAVAGGSRIEAFAFGTRLTRLSRVLATRDPDAALRAAASTVVDWSGGTQLGACLRRFNDDWGMRGFARNASVVVFSDGWDRGDPELVDAEMARLNRAAHRVVWVNPLKASPDYQPLARGMAAALPHVDLFLEGHNVAALEELAEVLGG